MRRTGTDDTLVGRHPLGLAEKDDEACWITGVALPADGAVLAGL